MSVWTVLAAGAIAFLLWGAICVKMARLTDHEMAYKAADRAIREYTFKKVNGWDAAWILLALAFPCGFALAIALVGTLKLSGVF